MDKKKIELPAHKSLEGVKAFGNRGKNLKSKPGKRIMNESRYDSNSLDLQNEMLARQIIQGKIFTKVSSASVLSPIINDTITVADNNYSLII
ncbi:hypothetical protein X798_06572 [Onchocerca flexuosa]|uniref:Uncharacterized protein n=1 Tax=Onchocerca flexuosa TaxID=387005 RepID=A0A238BP57_9BILA|nr:hypothetical protein X798_06572 [Onchocerca flexuosa]